MKNKIFGFAVVAVVVLVLAVFVTLFVSESLECKRYSAIYVSENDVVVMQPETLRQVVAHNKLYDSHCKAYNENYYNTEKLTVDKLQRAVKKWKR